MTDTEAAAVLEKQDGPPELIEACKIGAEAIRKLIPEKIRLRIEYLNEWQRWYVGARCPACGNDVLSFGTWLEEKPDEEDAKDMVRRGLVRNGHGCACQKCQQWLDFSEYVDY